LHGTNSYYIAKYAAKAVQARAKLYQGDYAGARDAALSVVQNGGYTLAAPTAFANYWGGTTGTAAKLETIWELSLNTATNNGTNGLDWMYSQPNFGYGDALATNELYELHTATDVRRGLILNTIRSANGLQAYVVNKYKNTNITDRDDIKIIRYAEVVITLAEAYARLGDETNARTYLNQLAVQRDPALAPLGYVSTGAQLITDILNERRKELAFEGLRFFDFKRLNLVINRPQTQAQGSAPTYPTVSLTDTKRLLPIPQSERDANPNLVPNPGYN